MAAAQSPGMSKISAAIPTPVFDTLGSMAKHAGIKPATLVGIIITQFTEKKFKLEAAPGIKDLYK